MSIQEVKLSGCECLELQVRARATPGVRTSALTLPIPPLVRPLHNLAPGGSARLAAGARRRKDRHE